MAGTPIDPPLINLPYLNQLCNNYGLSAANGAYSFKFEKGEQFAIYAFFHFQGSIYIKKRGGQDGLVALKCVSIENGFENLHPSPCSSDQFYIAVADEYGAIIYRVYFTINPSTGTLTVCAVSAVENNPVRFMPQASGLGSTVILTYNSDSATDAIIATYPNPFHDLLEVNIPGSTREQDVQVALYDLQGRQILNQQFPGGMNAYALSTQDVTPGIYALHARYGDVSKVVKVVKAQ